MKLISIVLLSLFSLSISAEIYQIECISKEIDGVHRFDAKGILVSDDFNAVEGMINIKTVKSNEPSSVLVFEQIRVTGFMKSFKQGDISKNDFQQFFLKAENGYLKSLNLIIGLDVPQVSKIVAIDNFNYRSDCQYFID